MDTTKVSGTLDTGSIPVGTTKVAVEFQTSTRFLSNCHLNPSSHLPTFVYF